MSVIDDAPRARRYEASFAGSVAILAWPELATLLFIFCLWLNVPALAVQPFERICIANNLASTSDLKVRVDRTESDARSSVFTDLSGPKVTYQISGWVMPR